MALLKDVLGFDFSQTMVKCPPYTYVRRNSWPEGEYFAPIFVTKKDECWGITNEGYGVIYDLDGYDDFVAYKKPKGKVKMWKWACKSNSGNWMDSQHFYSEKPVFGTEFAKNTWVKVEGSMIEVDE